MRRRVAATTAKLLGDIHPLAIHRRLPGKLEEARQILAANWRLNAPPHANTTPRLAFLRYLLALLGSPPTAEFRTALVAALNDRAKLPDLDRFPEWRDQPSIPLDAPWPD